MNSGFFRDYQFELFENLGLNLGLEQKFPSLMQFFRSIMVGDMGDQLKTQNSLIF